MHDDVDPVTPFLPSAKGEGEPPQRLAVILLEADLLRRDTWEQEVELSTALYERYPQEQPPPAADFRDRAYQLVDPARPTRRQRCSSCFLSPGKTLCARCAGTGRDPDSLPCTCEDGYRACSTCDGSGSTVRATVRHVNDHAVRVRRTFVPEAGAPLARLLEAALEAMGEPPAALRFELQASLVASPYRDAAAVREPDFHGHRFDDALPAALAAVAELARYASVVKQDVRAYAWPFVLVRAVDRPGAPARTAALLHDVTGTPRMLGQ